MRALLMTLNSVSPPRTTMTEITHGGVTFTELFFFLLLLLLSAVILLEEH